MIKKIELFIYFAIWISAVLYSIYCFTESSNKYFRYFDDEYSDFEDGWIFLSRKKDKSDFEWQTLKCLIKELYLWIIILISISELLRKLKLIQILRYWQILISISYIINQFGFIPLIIILFQPLIFFVFVSFFKSRSCIWLCEFFCLITISLYKYLSASEDFLFILKINDQKIPFVLNINEQQSYIIIVAIFWMNIKCASYSLDNFQNFQLIQFLAYCFYLPTLFSGPFINYRDFKNIYFHQNNFKLRLLQLFLNVGRFLYWFAFAELCLHFIYVNATSFQPQLVEKIDLWSLYGYGYFMGQFFHIKYLVLYGLSTSLAKFEYISVPALPKCIGRIHLYSDMWKYFDAGLYNFLLKHIYVPSMNSRLVQNKFVSSFLCFAFVYIWHGIDLYIFIWTSLNYLGVVLENLSEQFWKKYSKKVDFLGESCIRRFICLISSPLLALSALANFYFFARCPIGNIFVYKLFHGSLLANAVLIFVLYCCCQVSTELRIKDKKVKKNI